MAWPQTLTYEQSDRLVEVVEHLVSTVKGDQTVPAHFRMCCSMVENCLLEGRTLDHPELVALKGMLEIVFDGYEDQYDEQLERAFHKLFYEWPIDPPWFERKAAGARDVGNVLPILDFTV